MVHEENCFEGCTKFGQYSKIYHGWPYGSLRLLCSPWEIRHVGPTPIFSHFGVMGRRGQGSPTSDIPSATTTNEKLANRWRGWSVQLHTWGVSFTDTHRLHIAYMTIHKCKTVSTHVKCLSLYSFFLFPTVMLECRYQTHWIECSESMN